MASKLERSKLDTRIDEELDDIFAGLGPEVSTVKLYRLEGGKQQALNTYTPSQLASNAEEVIGADFGPGQYLVRVILPNSNGRGNRWGPSKVLSLADDSSYVQEYLKRHANDAPEQAAGGYSDPMFRILELQLKLAEQRAADTDKRLAQQNDQFHQLILAMIQNKGGGGDIGSIIAGVKDLKQLSDGGGGGGSRLEELKDLIEIAGMLKGGGADESPWSSLSKIVSAGLMREKQGSRLTVETSAPAAAAAIAAPIAKPAELEPAAAPPAPPAPTLPTLREHLTLKAEHQRDAELWADWLVETADDDETPEAIALVSEIAQAADFETWSASSAPPIADKLQLWWKQFFNRVREVIVESAPPQPEKPASQKAGAK